MRKNYVILLLLLVIPSCFKQAPPELKDDYRLGDANPSRLKACAQTNFNKNVLEKRNLKNLFVCTKWDLNFPEMYNGIRKINEKNWNNFFGPLDREFLTKKETRDRLIRSIINLSNDGALDDFSTILTSLNSTNVYDSWRDIFFCALNKDDHTCQGKVSLNIDDLDNLIKIFPKDEEGYLLLYKNFINFKKALLKSHKTFGEELYKIHDHPRFIAGRISFFDGMSLSLRKNLPTNWRNLYANFFNAKYKEDPWLYHWLYNKKNQNTFNYIIRYPFHYYPGFSSDLYLLKEGYRKGITCKSDHSFVVDIKASSNTQIEYIKAQNAENFSSSLLEEISTITLSKDICPQLIGKDIGTEKNINYLNFLEKISAFNSSSSRFHFTSFLLNLLDPKAEKDKLDLLSYFSSSEMLSTLSFLNTLIDLNPDLFEEGLFLLKQLSGEGFFDIGLIARKIYDIKNKKSADSFNKVWQILNPDSKTHILRLMDHHFFPEIDLNSLLKFYEVIFKEFVISAPKLANEYNSNRKARENTIKALADIADKLAGENTLKEFTTFFSEKHILKIVDVLMNGDKIKVYASKKLNWDRYEQLKKKQQYPQYKLVDGNNENTGECIEAILKLKNVNDFIDHFPQKCVHAKGFNFQLVQNFKKANIEFRKNSNMKIDPFSTDYLLSPRLIAENVHNLKIIHDNYGDKEFLNLIEDLLSPKTGIINKEVNNLLASLSSIFKKSNGQDLFRNDVLQRLLDTDNIKKINLILEKYPILRKNFIAWKKRGSYDRRLSQKKNYSTQYKCQKFNNEEIGGFPCATLDVVKTILRRIIAIAQRKNGTGRVTGIESLLAGFSVSHGVEIPYASNSSQSKVLTVGEMVSMLYDLTDKTLAINNSTISYYQNKDLDRDYIKYSNAEYAVIEDDLLDKHEDSFEKKRERFTTMERVEASVREVRFDLNYLGVHYKNAVARSKNYNKVVSEKKKLFQTCVGFKFCGKWLNKSEKKMAKNAIAVFDGLGDLNSKESFRYGDFTKGLLSVLVKSSSEAASVAPMKTIKILRKKIKVPVKIKNSSLKKHNGSLLTNLTMIAGFSNMARFIRGHILLDQSIDSLINSKVMKRLNNFLLKDIDPKVLAGYLLDSLNEIDENVKRGEEHPVSWIVDYLANLSDQELFYIEDLVINSLIVLTYADNSNTQLQANYWNIFAKVLPIWQRFRPLFEDPQVKGEIRIISEWLEYLVTEIEAGNTNVLVIIREGLSLLDSVIQDPGASNILEKFILMGRKHDISNEFREIGVAMISIVEKLGQDNKTSQQASDFLDKVILQKEFSIKGMIEFLELSTLRPREGVDNSLYDFAGESIKVLALKEHGISGFDTFITHIVGLKEAYVDYFGKYFPHIKFLKKNTIMNYSP